MKSKSHIIHALTFGGLVLVIDQVIKGYIRHQPLHTVLYTLGGLIEIIHCTNTGAAFSIFSGNSMGIAIASAVLLLILLLYFFREVKMTHARTIATSILCGAGLGNWIDRVLLDGVTDYIRLTFIRFPVFNFADICITLSVVYLAISLFTEGTEECSGA